MKSITSILLIIDSIQQRDKQFESTLAKSGYQIHAIVEAQSNLLANYQQHQSDLLIACVAHVKQDLLHHFQKIIQAHPLPVIIFTPDKSQDSIDMAIKSGISAYIVDGFQENRIGPIINIAVSRFNVVKELQNQLQQTQQRLEERKLIDKAKGIIMQEKSLSEAQAYTLLRKTAMNKNCTIATIASNIIEFYQLMN